MNRASNFRNKSLPYGNPLANALVVIVGLIVIAVSIVIGVVAFFAFAAAIVILVCILAVRGWWMKRRSPSGPQQPGSHSGKSDGSDAVAIIEGEYQVIPGDRDKRSSRET